MLTKSMLKVIVFWANMRKTMAKHVENYFHNKLSLTNVPC